MLYMVEIEHYMTHIFQLDDVSMSGLLFFELLVKLALGFSDSSWNLFLTHYFLVDMSCYYLD